MIWLYMCPSQTVNGWHAYEDIPNHSGYQLEARTSGSIDVHWIRCDWAKHRIHVCSAAPQTSPRTHGDRITASSAAGIELWMHLLLQNVMLWTAKMSHFVCSHTIQGTPPIVIIQYLNGIPPFFNSRKRGLLIQGWHYKLFSNIFRMCMTIMKNRCTCWNLNGETCALSSVGLVNVGALYSSTASKVLTQLDTPNRNDVHAPNIPSGKLT